MQETEISPTSTAEQKRTLRVLVVDDTRANRMVLVAFLRRMGHIPLEAENGGVGVEIFAREQPDVVLMDVMMPVMDGLEATRRIKNLCTDRWVPVIFLSALGADNDVVAGLEAGGDDYLVKPVNFTIMTAKLRAIERTIELRERGDAARRRVEAISNTVLDAIITIDRVGTIQTCNRAATRIFGYLPDAMLGKNVRMLMPDTEAGRHDSNIRRFLETRVARKVGTVRELTGRRADGQQFPIEVALNEMVLDGEPHFVGTIRDISARKQAEDELRRQAERLQRFHDAQQEETRLARDIMERQTHQPSLNDPKVQYALQAAEHFSGDVVACARSSSGRLYAMLADATGHGLSAAISVLPVLAVFYGMTRRGLPMTQILSEMNKKLRVTLPVGRFVALSLLCVDEQERCADIWLGGMPDLLWLDRAGSGMQRFKSTHLPLGITDWDESEGQPLRFEWKEPGLFALYSDGVVESADPRGSMFGEASLISILRAAPRNERIAAVAGAIASHLEGYPAQDDQSLLVVECD
ncbi:MAG: SpoIIE family protein phosphatase [Rhodocyclaceae bacterium]|nr:SpoIIE family protein phosphatase [Rhodocyclaceae bacterium]MBX3670031.1 SpoIIE family protein phosphatase [Rhodocyclaceae bacterium]